MTDRRGLPTWVVEWAAWLTRNHGRRGGHLQPYGHLAVAVPHMLNAQEQEECAVCMGKYGGLPEKPPSLEAINEMVRDEATEAMAHALTAGVRTGGGAVRVDDDE